MIRFLSILLLGVHAWCAEAVVWMHVKAPMRDGVKLCANIYRPAGAARVPVVLQRTPYGKVGELTPGLKAFVDRGYAVMTQDVRGRGHSEGEFRQYLQEGQDGEDTLSWIARQAWSDGRVGMFGGSYVGISQWRTALSGHPALKAIAPAVSGGDEYFDRFYSRGGAFRLAHRWRWVAENYKPAGTPVVEFQKMVTYLPLRRADGFLTGQVVDFYQAAMAHPSYDEYWKGLSTRARVERVKVPALIEAGWYDVFAESDLEMFSAMRAAGKAARIVVGPWGHNSSPVMPQADFGKDASAPLRRMEIDWFDAYVKQSGQPPPLGVMYFVMGVNKWRESAVWPPAGMELTPLYLYSRKSANSANGDGVLVAAPPRESGTSRYSYDPKRAVPTVGGANCCNQRVLAWGPLDQRAVEGRRDVLVFTGEVLKDDLEVTGPVRVVLHVSSSAPDTDFTAKLVDVAPDGRAKILCDGILRLRYRRGLTRALAYVPGEVERIEIPAGVTSNVFRSGHRVRLEVSSSNFPKYDRNMNTGRAQADEREMRVARQEVRHGGKWVSYIVLPVVR
jgi:uncharacterized protein